MIIPSITRYAVPAYPVDKILKTVTGTVTIPQGTSRGAGAGALTVAHSLGQNVFPILSYSYNGGTRWFSNGQYEMYYNGSFFAYEPKLWGVANADTANTYIEWQSGSATGTLTVQYRIRLVGLD